MRFAGRRPSKTGDRNFINTGTERRGTFVKATRMSCSRNFPGNTARTARITGTRALDGNTLAVRLGDDNLLVNGCRLCLAIRAYQSDVLRTLEHSHRPFGVVPFHSIGCRLDRRRRSRLGPGADSNRATLEEVSGSSRAKGNDGGK